MIYKCKCIKCKKDYESENELDTDNEGYCLSCKELKIKLAEEIQAKIGTSSRIQKPIDLDSLPRVNGKFIDARLIL